jgi:hypothetical protein
MEVDDDLSTALGTETLADRDMVPPSFDDSLDSSADTLPIETFEHRRFLRVERSATLRSGQRVSKIWDYGTERSTHRNLTNIGNVTTAIEGNMMSREE